MLTSLAQQDSIVISISPRVSIHQLANIRLLPYIETNPRSTQITLLSSNS